MSKERKEARFTSKIFITKWVSSTAVTGNGMVLRKQRITSDYPRFNLNNEDTTHNFQY